MARVVWIERIPFELAGPSPSGTYTVELDGQQFVGVRPGAYGIRFDDGTIQVAYPDKVTLRFIGRED